MAQVTETHAVFEGELVTHKQNYERKYLRTKSKFI